MAVTLPLVPTVPLQRFSTVLDETTYLFDVRWNARAGAWYMDLFDSDEVPIRHGIKIVLGALLGRRVADARFPAGEFMAADLSGAGLEATLDDLGVRVLVFYMPASEIESIKSGA